MLLAATACLGGCQAPVCVAGETRACLGAGACQGSQACNAEGSGLGSCDCGSGAVGGSADAGADAGTDGGASASVDAGNAVPIAMGQTGPLGIAVDATHVYWTTYGDGTVMKVPLAGGSALPLASNLATTSRHPSAIAVNATFVY